MAQEVKKVEVVMVDEKCPQCNKGYMRPTGIVLTSNPPHYPHKCNKCGYEQTYGNTFPYTMNQTV